MNFKEALNELWALRPKGKQKHPSFRHNRGGASNRTWSRRKISLTKGEWHLSPSSGNVGTQPGQRYHRRRAVREEGWKAVKNAAKAIREAA